MRKIVAVLVCLLMLVQVVAYADTLQLPNGILAIGNEAFEACENITAVVIPDGALYIGPRAFADCTNLLEVDIPSSIINIYSDAFSGCTAPLLIRTSAGSAAAAFARTAGIDYQADTTYRALLISQSAYEESTVLYGPPNDVATMSRILTSSEKTKYSTVIKRDCTATEIQNAIATTFADATENDVSLFYYSGHGLNSNATSYVGALLGVDYSSTNTTGADYFVTATELRSYLDAIPGRKIVIIDACHSGNMIGKSVGSDMPGSASAFNNSFISAFSWVARSNLAADGYFVMTAAHSTESSVEVGTSSGGYVGLFTYYLGIGCGYNQLTGSACTPAADSNADGVISFYEAYAYARSQAAAFQGANQTAQIWPSSTSHFGFIR